MPEKSVREMSAVERKFYSLEARTFHSTVMGAIIFGLAALLIGLGFYTYALIHQRITEAFTLSRSAAAILQEVVDVEPYADDLMVAFHDQNRNRLEPMTPEYRERFAPFTGREDYSTIRQVLDKFLSASEIDALYLGIYDEQNSVLVFMADPDTDPETAVLPGDYEAAKWDTVQEFLRWNGEGELYELTKTERLGWICTGGIPIRNADGKPVAFVMADIALGSVVGGMKTFVLGFSITMAVLTALVAVLMSLHMKKKLVKPVNAIAEAAQKYVADRKAGVKGTSHFADLNIRTGDEVENLNLIMADMERDLTEYEENLTSITAEKERISTELNLATRIQGDMLPNIYPAFSDRNEFDIFGSMDPAREVGGDFYDFFLVDEDHLCMVMADVSGKGVPAALFMMASKIILANNAMIGKTPGQILTDTNAAICQNNREEMFVTVWLGILELSTGKLTAANAGHEYPVLQQAGGQFKLYKDKHGFVIGGMAGVKYKEYELTLQPGSRLFLYTDGVPEATDADNEMFGTDRMLAALNVDPVAHPKEILKNVRGAVDGFVKEAEQFDDLTMLCIEYKGPEEKGGEKREN